MKKNLFRLIIHQENDPYFNMAADEAISFNVGNNLSLPTLRFYRWNPATLSLGYFQKFEKEINYEFCQNNNIGIVRRITGGRAVLHDDEITYSISIPSNNILFEKNLIDSYKLISEALFEGLLLLGLKPEFNYKKLPAEHSSAACFDSPSLYEITINNKKIIGSAQKRFQNSFLQHGSIPFTINIEKLFNCFNLDNPQIKEKLINNFKEKAIGINDLLTSKISSIDLINAFSEGFKRKLGIEFIIDNLSNEEIEMINTVLYNKYSSKEWLKKY
ncbi:MAG: biotin/lipoate A/B protein ligase family protein [Exilispira sp.]